MASTAVALRDGCDVDVGDSEANPVAFADELMRCLLKKGFCVAAGNDTSEGLADAVREVKQLSFGGHLEKPPAEIAEGLLGAEGSSRYAELQRRAQEPDDSTRLGAVDERMYKLGQLMEPLCEPYLGFELRSRGRGFVLEAGSEEFEETPELNADTCYRWLTTFEAHRVMCLHFLGPGSGQLEMKPYDEVSGVHKVNVVPGMWVILRADMLSHSYSPKGTGYAVGSFFFSNQSDAEPRRKQREFPRTPVAEKLDKWLLQTVKTLKENIANEDELEALTSRAVQRMTNQMYHKGAQISVRGQACRFPALSSNTEFYRAMLFTGTDSAEQIPFTRWDNDVYYTDVDSNTLTQMANQAGYSHLRDRYNCQHGAFVEGLDLFDNKFFSLSLNESLGMDPNQRQLLEVMYEVAFSAGMKKPKLMKAQIGVYTGGPGQTETEWMAVAERAGCGGATGASPAVLSNRLSYAYGMNGPNFLMTADAASSLVALGLATDALQRAKPQCDAAFALGVDCIVSMHGYSFYCWAGQMSMRGRCFTFDETADGYIRGEGTGGVFMNPYMHEIDGEVVVDEDPPSLGLCNGVWTAHSGKSASLSAPSGSQDQELIAGALREADISPLDVDSVDAHGLGSVLSDAVEVMALNRAYRSRTRGHRPDDVVEMLGVTCVKTNNGNGKPVAGQFAIIKALLSLELGQLAPSCHMRKVNPHLDLFDAPLYFNSEHTPSRMNSGFTGITAKGFGGTCAHAILWGAVNFDRVTLPRPRLEPREIVYWPGGGGELEYEAKPTKTYAVVGSWSSWSKPEPMKADGKGGFSLDIVMGDLGFERFQIWLDNDSDRVLHPGFAGATRDMPVRGPSSSAEAHGHHWMIAGAGWSQQAALEGGGEEAAPPRTADEPKLGDVLRIQVLTNGRYRTVTWTRTSTPATPAAGSTGRYFMAASWNQWGLEELQEVADAPGTYRAEARLMRSPGTFVLVRNEDWRQVIYPAGRSADSGGEGSAVLGPDEYGRGAEWLIRGELGDVFEVELRRSSAEAGPVSFGVDWRFLRNDALDKKQLAEAKQPEFYIVGSWDYWIQRYAMLWDGENYVYEVTVPPSRAVNFQILMDGDWNRAIFPSMPDAGPRDRAMLRGPGVGDTSWMIGKDPQEENGGRFEVTLIVKAGRPTGVSWSRR